MPRSPATPGATVPLRRALVAGYAAAAAGLVLACAVGWLVAGTEGLWGGVLGIAVPVGFLSITAVVGLATARMAPGAMGAVVLGSWLLKVILLLVVLFALRDATFFSRGVFFVVFALAVVGYLVLEAVVVLRTRVPYVEPGSGRSGPAPG